MGGVNQLIEKKVYAGVEKTYSFLPIIIVTKG